MYSTYWQVVLEEDAHERMELFTLGRKMRRKGMHMRDLNTNPTFVAMIMNLQMELGALFKERGLNFFASEIIVDDVLLYGCITNQFLEYFRTFLDVLK